MNPIVSRMALTCGLAIVGLPNLAVAESPDPAALMRAVGASRLALRAGTLDAEVRYVRPSFPAGQVTALTVQFCGERRTVVVRQKLNYVDDENEERFDSLGRDHAKAIAAGVVTQRDTTIHSCWDGKDYADFWDNFPPVTFREHKYGKAKMMLDPRMIGVDPYYAVDGDLAQHVPIAAATSTAIRPTLAGPAGAFDVTVNVAGGSVCTFTVSPNAPYRVHAVATTYGKGRSYTIQSEFGKGDSHPLPQRCTVRHSDATGKVLNEHTITIRKAVLNETCDNRVGTLASLPLSINTPVLDNRKDTPLGYWDGQAISPRRAPQPKAAMPAAVPVPPPSGWSAGRIALAVTAVLAVFAVAVLVARRRSAAA